MLTSDGDLHAVIPYLLSLNGMTLKPIRQVLPANQMISKLTCNKYTSIKKLPVYGCLSYEIRIYTVGTQGKIGTRTQRKF